MKDEQDSLEEGANIAGRYLVRKALGCGGTGFVYEVLDERTQQKLALKLLHARRSGPGSVSAALFEREYHTLCQLAHPRIIDVFDYGVESGRGFYTMELLDGQDLQSLGVLPWPRACALLCDVASSLAVIHSRRLVHRDVSARNVRCTSDGRAKLLDFGAMAAMGVARDPIGTPPYLAPEALEMQGLDGRADLYALGALAYLLLTGYHAYEARTFQGLRAIWRSAPMLPSQYVEGIPTPLDQLVMELLQLERTARPSNAAEVMERLSGIASLPLIELPEVKHSYLVMPSLVGREAEVSAARTALASMLATGHGDALCIEGEAGVGRSRLLDASVLEARLLGALVLRGDAADSAEGGEYGLLRALCAQLFDLDPDVCERIGRRRWASVAFLLPALAKSEPPPAEPAVAADGVDKDTKDPGPPRTQTPPGAALERRALLGTAQELFFDAARSHPVVIAVDDCHAIDEPSAALLGMLARLGKQRRLVLITTSALDAQPSPALNVLREASTRTRLPPLSAEQSEALLRSVFGEVAHIAPVSATIFEVAAGNPKATMTLAEHLIDRDLARYEAGAWSLPAELAARELPSSVSDALHERLHTLSDAARDFAETLSLVDPTTVALDRYRALARPDDQAHVYRALDELIAAGILVRVGERCRFAQPALADRLERELTPEHKRRLHERIAQALQNGATDAGIARHWLLGGHERRAIESLRAAFAQVALIDGRDLELLRAAVDAARRLGLGLETRLELHAFLLQAASSAGRRDLFFTEDARVLRQHCESDSGLLDYRALPTDEPPLVRAQAAVARTRERYEATSDAERGLGPDHVADTVTRVYFAQNSMGSSAQDLTLIEDLPRLDPLFSEFPQWQPVQSLIDVQSALQQGRTTLATERATVLIRTVDEQQGALLGLGLSNQARFAALLLLAMFAATGGQDTVSALIAELNDTPGHRSNAWRVRMVFELMRGNLAVAADCQRHAELLHLQDSGRMLFPGGTTRIELLAHMYAENVLGVKHVMERIAQLAARHPGWQPTLAIARCHYHRLHGDAQGGLLELEPALTTKAGRHLDWWLVAYSHIKVLCDLLRWEDAVRAGMCYLQTWTEQRLSDIDYGLQQVTAEALTHVGRFEEARQMIERYIAMHMNLGTRGLRLGLAYETAARLAMAEGDELAVSRYMTLCASEYRGGRDLLLKAKLERLTREAEDFRMPGVAPACVSP